MTRTRILSLGLATFTAVSMSACGGSERPEAPPGTPMNPPQEDPALAEMMAETPSHPTATATASAATPLASASAAPSASAAKPKQPPPPAPKH